MKMKVAVMVSLFLLLPAFLATAQAPGNIYDTLKAAGNFKTLVAALDKANIKELKAMQGPFTAFAPTDEAWAKLPKQTYDRIMADEQILKNILYYHIVPGLYMAKDLPALKQCKTLCPTTEAEILTFQLAGAGDVMVVNAKIVQPDMKASNGVAHGIDTVLMPKFAPPKIP
jgi:uncharacterized surface protein with fasciclin (FAS1) repeats